MLLSPCSVVTGACTKFDFTALPQTSLLGLKGSTSKGRREKKKLEIWGKAQRESARRPKSDWGKLEEGGKIIPASKSRGPNSNALAYAEQALST